MRDGSWCWKFFGRHHDLFCVTNDHGYFPLFVNTSWSFPHSWLITGFVTRVTRQMPLVEQELLTLPKYLMSLPVFSVVRVTRSYVLYICFLDVCPFSFGHCVVCPSSIYELWLPLLVSSNSSWCHLICYIFVFQNHYNIMNNVRRFLYWNRIWNLILINEKSVLSTLLLLRNISDSKQCIFVAYCLFE